MIQSKTIHAAWSELWPDYDGPDAPSSEVVEMFVRIIELKKVRTLIRSRGSYSPHDEERRILKAIEKLEKEADS